MVLVLEICIYVIMAYYLNQNLYNGGIILIIGIVSSNNFKKKMNIVNVLKLVNIC